MYLQARLARTRVATNENDENAGTTRLTRAKAAALGGSHDALQGDIVKKSLQRTKSTTSVATTNGTAQPRKRAALGDVSNVAKNDFDAKNTKKPLTSKGGLVSKAAQPSKIQKPTRTNSARSVLGDRDRNVAASELKRPASGSGIVGNVAKKQRNASTGSSKSIPEEDLQTSENAALPKPKLVVAVEIPKPAQLTVEAPKQEAIVKPEKALLPEDSMIPDLDQEDHDDPLMVAEYVGEIFDYLREVELQTMANENYMDNQHELEWKMRGILVDWLLEVHTRFRLLPETLFLAVNIIDRFLSTKIVQLDRLQLVGVTAMFIASKYEEVLSPHVQNFRHVADDGFTEDEILSAERFVLQALNYNLSYPNPMNFLRRISKADNYDIQTRTLGKYLLEISCLDHRFIPYPPSQVAAASMYLARLVLERGDWVSSPCIQFVRLTLTSPGRHYHALRWLYGGRDSASVPAHARLSFEPCGARSVLQEVR